VNFGLKLSPKNNSVSITIYPDLQKLLTPIIVSLSRYGAGRIERSPFSAGLRRGRRASYGWMFSYERDDSPAPRTITVRHRSPFIAEALARPPTNLPPPPTRKTFFLRAFLGRCFGACRTLWQQEMKRAVFFGLVRYRTVLHDRGEKPSMTVKGKTWTAHKNLWRGRPFSFLLCLVLLSAAFCAKAEETDFPTAPEKAWMEAHPAITIASDLDSSPIAHFDANDEYDKWSHWNDVAPSLNPFWVGIPACLTIVCLVAVGLLVWNRSLNSLVNEQTQALSVELRERRRMEDALRF